MCSYSSMLIIASGLRQKCLKRPKIGTPEAFLQAMANEPFSRSFESAIASTITALTKIASEAKPNTFQSSYMKLRAKMAPHLRGAVKYKLENMHAYR
jgi:hypothetical protein